MEIIYKSKQCQKLFKELTPLYYSDIFFLEAYLTFAVLDNSIKSYQIK
jgi:hypothetical protein